MSVTASALAIQKRRLVVRSILVVLYLALGVIVFLIGRTHLVIVDYAGSEDGSYEAVEQVVVYVGKNEGLEYMGGDFRDQVRVRGQRHRLVIETFTGDKSEHEFSIPVEDDIVLLSVAKAAAGITPFVDKFVPSLRAAPLEADTETIAGTEEYKAGGEVIFQEKPGAPPEAPPTVPSP